MAKRQRRGGRVTKRQQRKPDIMDDVAALLDEDHPFPLLAMCSSLLAVLDERTVSPLDRLRGSASDSIDRADLLQSLKGVDIAETTALLMAFAALTPDEGERSVLRRELATRRHALPPWVALLGESPEPYRAFELVHPHGDSEGLFVGARLGTFEFLVALSIDHNAGTLVEDATVEPTPVDEILVVMAQDDDPDPDATLNEIGLADARVRIEEAISLASMTWPRIDTDSWPSCRALVEWICRHLPEGGVSTAPAELTEKQIGEIIDRFVASEHTEGMDRVDARDIVQTFLWFTSGYRGGDPLRWSPASVEILLEDWLPRKVVADAAYLSRVPTVLRAFVRFCDAERGLRPELTAQTIEVIDELAPAYEKRPRSSPRSNVAGPKAKKGQAGQLQLDLSVVSRESWQDLARAGLEAAVGGAEPLAELDDEPLPDEPFTGQGIPADLTTSVGAALGLIDRFCERVLDIEYRTACRRLLARAARNDPDAFRSGTRAETNAAAVCWVIGRANGLFDREPALLVKDVMEFFGVKGSASQRGLRLIEAAGLEADMSYAAAKLGTVDLLVSDQRRHLIERRNQLLAGSG